MFYYSVISQINIPNIGQLDDFPHFPTRYSAYKYRSDPDKVIAVSFSNRPYYLPKVEYFVVSGDYYRSIKKYRDIDGGSYEDLRDL